MKKLLYLGLTRPQEIQLANTEKIHLYHCPTIQICYLFPADAHSLKNFSKNSQRIVFFSKHGVLGTVRWLSRIGQLGILHSSEIWAVGEKTAGEIASQCNIRAHCPTRPDAQGMIDEFRYLTKSPITLFVGDKSRPQFPLWLQQQRWSFTKYIVYTSSLFANPELLQVFTNHPDEYIFFTSPSTIEGFLLSLQISNLQAIASRLLSIGSTTSQAIRGYGGEVFAEAVKPDVQQSLRQWLRQL